MILAINIGNTNLTYGIFDGARILATKKFRNTNVKGLEDIDLNNGKIDGVVLASVVPTVTPEVVQFLKKLNLPDPLIVRSALHLPIKISTDNPEKVGADLIANMVAACELYKKPLIVLDCGTATTFCLLLPGEEFAGSIIAPGLQSLSDSLTNNAALLPKTEVKKPENLLGKNTVNSMQSGVYFGYVGLVKEIVRKLKNEYPEAKIIGTGGNLKTFISEIEDIDEVNYNLNLEGLRIIYELNK